jgi:hypothetical protein
MADKVGKQYRGQTFVPIQSEAGLLAAAEAQKPYTKPDAVSLDSYFTIKSIRNPVMQAGMRAYTQVHSATIADWDTIFATY